MIENESRPLKSEDWNIVFVAYEEYPVLAFILAQHLDTIRQLVQQPEKRAAAVAALDRAIESLMPHTDFRDAGREVYLRAVAGNPSPKNPENYAVSCNKSSDTHDHDQ